MQVQEHSVYRFGPYQFDTKLLELRKNGDPVKLREQSCRILLLLLMRPGELITRDELRQTLWTEDTFVNFDKSLNTAVNTLRDALSDSAVNPLYVQTVPRQGYRFVASVQASTDNHLAAEDTEASSSVPAPHPLNRRPWSWIVPALVILLVACASIWLGRRVPGTVQFRVNPITSYTGEIRSPSLSPDGSQVAFSWTREGTTDADIYLQTIAGGEPTRLTDSPAEEFGPAWAPDGTAIAFLKTISSSSFDVMLVPPSGGQPRKIARISCPLADIYQNELLAWMPDGKSLLFPDAAGTERQAIWSVDIHTGLRTQLTYPEAPVIGHSLPSIRNDQRVLVYQQIGGPYFYSLATVGLSHAGKPVGNTTLIANGSNIAPIGWIGNDLVFSSRSNDTFFKRWSPPGTISRFEIPDIDGMSARIGSVSGSITRDGRRMAVGLFRWDVHIWKADILPDGVGAHARRLIASTFRDLNPDYSPDGRQIVFKSTRSGEDDAWISLADGTRSRQLTHIGSVGYPRWSPDGEKIAFNCSLQGSRVNVCTADSETGDVHQITRGTSSDKNPSWSHDGHSIYFDSDRTGRSEIWKVPRGGGPEIQITKTGGVSPMESPAAKYIYFGKEEAGKTYVWRMSLASGTEERLFPSEIGMEAVAMGNRHLYFIGVPSSPAKFGTTIYSYDLLTGRMCEVVKGGLAIGGPAPSPDEKHLVYGMVEKAGGDLLVIDGLQKR